MKTLSYWWLPKTLTKSNVRSRVPATQKIKVEDILEMKIRNAYVVPVKTISNGDCLFAAFGMAKRGIILPVEKQAGLADKYRQIAVHYMGTQDFQDRVLLDHVYAAIDEVRLDRPVAEKMRHTIERLPINATMKKYYTSRLRTVMNNTRSGATRLNAYRNVMSISGMWSTPLELEALSHRFKVPVILVVDPSFKHNVPSKIKPGTIWQRSGVQYPGPPVFVLSNGVNHYEALVNIGSNARNKYGFIAKMGSVQPNIGLLQRRQAKIKDIKRFLKTKMPVSKAVYRDIAANIAKANNFDEKSIENLVRVYRSN